MKHGNKRIREIREQLGMSQIDLAEKAGITQAAISALELGAIKNPAVDVAQRIAQALGVKIEVLFPITTKAV
jgi:transcriptional regulator with XRE-family HTH domain